MLNRRLATLVASAVIVLAACSSSGATTAPTTAPTTAHDRPRKRTGVRRGRRLQGWRLLEQLPGGALGQVG